MTGYIQKRVIKNFVFCSLVSWVVVDQGEQDTLRLYEKIYKDNKFRLVYREGGISPVEHF